MSTLGNILWFLLIGFFSGLAWVFSGIFWCITVIGIPYGLQCFKFALLSFLPFGKDVRYGGGAVSLVANIIWVVFFGVWMAIGYLLAGALFAVTIIGIPFGKQCVKLAKLSLTPFGAEVVAA